MQFTSESGVALRGRGYGDSESESGGSFCWIILDRFVHAVPCSTDFHWLKRMNRVGTLKDWCKQQFVTLRGSCFKWLGHALLWVATIGVTIATFWVTWVVLVACPAATIWWEATNAYAWSLCWPSFLTAKPDIRSNRAHVAVLCIKRPKYGWHGTRK